MGIAPGAFQAPMKPAVASIVARLDGRQLATLPTDMTISPALPSLAAPAAAAEAQP
jgi:NADH-quinone oxidoreductase subunit M